MKPRLLCLTTALGLALGAGLAAAQEPKDTKERPEDQPGSTTTTQDPAPKTTTQRIKEGTSSALQSIKQGVSSAGESLREQYQKVRTAAQNMTVHNRVYSRLHWDKGLVGANIETEVREDGVTTLKGTVPDARAKSKAVLLANDTVGVTQVIDQLTVQPAPSTAPAGSTTTTTTTKKVETKPAPTPPQP